MTQAEVSSPLGIRLTGSFEGLRIVGDEAVDQPMVEGPHHTFRRGDELVIEGTAQDRAGRARVVRGARGPGSVVVQVRRGSATVVVRARPELAVAVDLDAASVHVESMTGAVAVRLGAGSLTVDGVRGTLDVDMLSGTVWVAGAPAGLCRVACETGNVEVALSAGADVVLDAMCGVGDVSWPDPLPPAGSGANHLRVRVGVGAIRILSPR